MEYICNARTFNVLKLQQYYIGSQNCMTSFKSPTEKSTDEYILFESLITMELFCMKFQDNKKLSKTTYLSTSNDEYPPVGLSMGT